MTKGKPMAKKKAAKKRKKPTPKPEYPETVYVRLSKTTRGRLYPAEVLEIDDLQEGQEVGEYVFVTYGAVTKLECVELVPDKQ